MLLNLSDNCYLQETVSEMEFIDGKKETKTNLTEILKGLNSGQSKDYVYLTEGNQKFPLIVRKKLTSDSTNNFIAIQISERKNEAASSVPETGIIKGRLLKLFFEDVISSA